MAQPSEAAPSFPVVAPASRTYAAFISYSHAADGRLAPALRDALQAFARPWYGRRACTVFLDQSSLSANPGLWSMVERALGGSEYFLLLASPDAAKSHWVAREIEWWLARRAVEKLLVVLTDGDLVWDEASFDFDWSRTTALPANLRGRLAQEPKHVDLRWARSDEALSLRHTRFREAVVDLAATLHAKPRDELDGEDLRHHRTLRRIAAMGVAALIVLAIAAGGAAVQWYRKAQEANLQAEKARQQAAIAERERKHAVEQTALAELQRASAIYQSGLATHNQHEAERETLRANQQRDLALSRELAARALTALQVDPESGINLARQAAGLSEAAEVEDALRQSLATPVSLTLVSPKSTAIGSAVFTPGGSFVVTTTSDGALLWDVRSGRVVRALVGEPKEPQWTVASAAISKDGKWVFAVSNDGTARGWDTATGQRVATFKYPGGPDRRRLSADEKWLSAPSENGTVRVWANPGAAQFELPLHPGGVGDEVYTPDWMSKVRVSPLEVLDAETGNVRTRLSGHVVPPFNVALSADGKCAVTASEDGTARVWDITTGAAEYVIAGHQGRLQSAAFDWVKHERCRPLSGKRYAVTTGHDDNTARVWELLSNGTTLNLAILRGHSGLVTRAVFSDDGKQIVTVSSDNTARVWHATWLEESQSAVDPAAEHITFDPAGKRLATMGDGNFTRVRSLVPNASPVRLQGSIRGVGRAAFNPNGSLVAVSGVGSTATVWDIVKRQAVGKPRHAGTVTSAAFSPDGHWLVTSSADGSVKVWSTANWQSPVTVLQTSAELAVFSPDSRWVATVEKEAAAVWDRETGRLVAECNADSRPAESARIGDRGMVRRLAIRGAPQQGTWASRICRSGGVLHAVGLAVFSPDAARVLTWERNIAIVRDSESWKSLLEIGDPSANVSFAAFSPNGNCVITTGEDRRGSASAEHRAWVWDARAGKLLLELRGHTNLLTTAAFTADSQRVATASFDHTVRIFQTRVCGTFRELVAQADERLRHSTVPAGSKKLQ